MAAPKLVLSSIKPNDESSATRLRLVTGWGTLGAVGLALLLLRSELLRLMVKGTLLHPELTIQTGVCSATSCMSKFATCLGDEACFKALVCTSGCVADNPPNKVAACSYLCEMTHGYENKEFLDLIVCMVNQKCLPVYPRDGVCKASDSDGVKTIDSLDKVSGDWWVIRGANCGVDDTYPGGYDWYPCQHERFIKQKSGQWINNVTYCGGKDNVCSTDMIVTVANISLPQPGVVKHEYTDAPLSPQTESWTIVSWPDQGDYLFMIWCGRLPILEYNGAIVLSRSRSDKGMPAKVLQEFTRVASRFGLDYGNLCPSDNTHCPF